LNVQPNPAIRFLRLEYDGYYPLGGVSGDLVGRFATLEAACEQKSHSETIEIYDTWTGEVRYMDYKGNVSEPTILELGR